jgi:hypothetical protein
MRTNKVKNFMANATLHKLIEEVKVLTSDEQRQLRELLDRLLIQQAESQSYGDALEQKLLEVGLLSESKPPITDFTQFPNRKPIEVKGKPLSEIILEERR